MDKKLTLSMDKNIIAEAKVYAKRNGTSLSKMIEAYLESLTNKYKEKDKLAGTPLVESLCGIIQLPNDFDYKSDRSKHLLDKHS